MSFVVFLSQNEETHVLPQLLVLVTGELGNQGSAQLGNEQCLTVVSKKVDLDLFKKYIQFIKFSKFISARLEARPGGKWHPVLLIVVIENGLLDLG